MPRTRAQDKDQIIETAMMQFWRFGYDVTSMDELVAATGASRHIIYADFGGKRDLYLNGFPAYQRLVVAPALEAMEAPGADLASIENYFERQISLAEQMGLPGPGCFIANTMTETAPHDPQVKQIVTAHHTRLKLAFQNVLLTEVKKIPPSKLSQADLDALSEFLVTSAQGLWSLSRIVDDAKPLRAHVSTLMTLIQLRVTS